MGTDGQTLIITLKQKKMPVADFKKYGRLYANPNAVGNDSVKIPVCSESDPCQDVYNAAVTGTEVIETVTINGVAYELPDAYQVAVNTGSGTGVYDALILPMSSGWEARS